MNTTLRTPFADAPARIAAWSWKRCAPERACSARTSISPSSPPASSIKLYASFSSSPDTRQDRQPSIPFMKWCKGGFRQKVQLPPLPDCVECPYFTMTYGRNTHQRQEYFSVVQRPVAITETDHKPRNPPLTIQPGERIFLSSGCMLIVMEVGYLRTNFKPAS